ncbi:MAG TPA: hypothetical protein VI912_03580 [Candidatus Bilamarchaeaceae archaeon]|nr:hypothetical protein [Candidatus Bilamarchaeaceae archaeon]
MKYKVKHISVYIDLPASRIYNFIYDLNNLSKWATGLSQIGKVKIKFADKNKFWILDHDVTLESGIKIYNPMRVIPNGKGGEVLFSLFQQPNMSKKEFSKDSGFVKKDLKRLKKILEKQK